MAAGIYRAEAMLIEARSANSRRLGLLLKARRQATVISCRYAAA